MSNSNNEINIINDIRPLIYRGPNIPSIRYGSSYVNQKKFTIAAGGTDNRSHSSCQSLNFSNSKFK